MKQQKPFLAGILFLISCLTACDSTEIGNSKDVNQDRIYMDYNIAYSESDEDVIVNLKYRFAGSAGTTLVLSAPSKVELDGKILAVDSSETAGAFYEVTQNASRFAGKHTIAFTDLHEKKWENSFDFVPFQINALPENAARDKDLIISYNTATLAEHDHVMINSMDTDSSFNYQQQGPNNSITIPAKELLRQKGKTLTLGCSVYREIPLTQAAAEGGLLKINYKLKPLKIKLQL